MKNKKGFTLIELLAVIVILAIIALIATPIILNMINNAKKSAAVDSAYGYIEAIENYQALAMLRGNDKLPIGTYNIEKSTTIDGKTYEQINNLVSIKGTKVKAGTVNITESGRVGTATMCVNNFLVDYQGEKAEVISNDCGDMGLIVEYAIDTPDWAAEKTLTITYPEGNYENYYKVESGKVLDGDTEVTNNQDIKTTNKVQTLKIKANSKIKSWSVNSSGKKVGERTYEETKIDTVEIATPTATISDSLSTLTSSGVVAPTKAKSLTVSFTPQEGTSAYYSLDNGSTWTKYTSPVGIDDNVTAKAKLVRDESKREGEAVTATSNSNSLSAVAANTYDGDDSSGSQTSGYLQISDEMKGKKISLYYGLYKCYSGGDGYIKFLDSNITLIDNASYTVSKPDNSCSYTYYRKSFQIPSDAAYVNLQFTGYGVYLNEIYADITE